MFETPLAPIPSPSRLDIHISGDEAFLLKAGTTIIKWCAAARVPFMMQVGFNILIGWGQRTLVVAGENEKFTARDSLEAKLLTTAYGPLPTDRIYFAFRDTGMRCSSIHTWLYVKERTLVSSRLDHMMRSHFLTPSSHPADFWFDLNGRNEYHLLGFMTKRGPEIK